MCAGKFFPAGLGPENGSIPEQTNPDFPWSRKSTLLGVATELPQGVSACV